MKIKNAPSERRVGFSPVPMNLRAILTDPQRDALSRLERFGWSIRFVRSQGLIEPVIVVFDPSGELHGVLLEDGRFDLSGGLRVR